MKKIYSLCMLAVFVLCSCSDDDDNKVKNGHQTVTSDFNGLLTTKDCLYLSNAQNGEKVYNEFGEVYKSIFSDKTGKFKFLNYTADWGSGPGLGGGFTYTNSDDVTTLNSIAAIAGEGIKGNTYLSVYVNRAYPTEMYVNGKEGGIVKSAYFTNAAYACISMQVGDFFAKKFEEGDWFKLTVTGKMDSIPTNKEEIYLADFRDGKKEILTKWKEIDLTGLGKVNSLSFELSSSDNGQFGMNTPAYFCMDAITVKF